MPHGVLLENQSGPPEIVAWELEPTDPPHVVSKVVELFLNQETNVMPVATNENTAPLLKRALAEGADTDIGGERLNRFRQLQRQLVPNISEQSYHLDERNVALARDLLNLLAAIEERKSWIDKAKCRGMNPNIFHPSKLRGQNARQKESIDRITRRARAVCNTCPVEAECLEYGQKYVGIGPKKDRPITVYGNRVFIER